MTYFSRGIGSSLEKRRKRYFIVSALGELSALQDGLGLLQAVHLNLPHLHTLRVVHREEVAAGLRFLDLRHDGGELALGRELFLFLLRDLALLLADLALQV